MVNNEPNASEVRTLFHLFNCTYVCYTYTEAQNSSIRMWYIVIVKNLRVISKCVVLRNTYKLAITRGAPIVISVLVSARSTISVQISANIG